MARRHKDTLDPYPDHAFERSLGEWVCGVDEAGRGPLAGPVVAAAVILMADTIPDGIGDSKTVKTGCRERLYDELHAGALIGVGIACVEEIDRMNILHASLLAMQRAVEALPQAAGLALIDGHMLPPTLPCAAHAIVRGDARCLSIGAASIIAKVTRDRMMKAHAQDYPGYGFDRHVGYATACHLEALERLGPTPLHRRSFAPVREALVRAA